MTITLTREEAQQVLDAIVLSMPMFVGHSKQHAAAIELLRARLGAPEPERPLKLGDMEQRAFDQECGFLSATAELRRLHEVNAELLKVLNDLADWESGEVSGYMDAPWVAQKARVAIAKATGEQQ
jgi:hypothetical protein